MSKKGRIVSLEELLALPDAEEITEVVEVAGLGRVRVRALSLNEHREMREDCSRGEAFDWTRWETLTLVHGMAEPQIAYDQAVLLRRKAAGAVDWLVSEIYRLSGLTGQGQLSAKAVDDAEASFRPEPDRGADVPAGPDPGEDGA